MPSLPPFPSPSPSPPASSSVSATTTETLKVVMRSRVMACGAPMTTSSTCVHAITPSARSCTLRMGWCAPWRLRTAASPCTPTSRKSPSCRAAWSMCTCPAWNRSKAPCTYTTRAPAGAAFPPLLNWMMRRLVVQKCETPPPTPPPLPPGTSSGIGGFVVSEATSMRPTMSVVEIPSVRLIILNLPAFFGASYASVPSGRIHGSSPCTMKSMRCVVYSSCMKAALISYGTSSSISSTHLMLSTTARRSASRNTGGPLHRKISASPTSPTTSSSPHALAWRSALAWPKCVRSKQPSM
mmetsp:Transcript_33967/g.85493  ORF Transcript_33967/g.85493 Transcript_33967/m.85493 type:complete len:296 (-) Transcript_33967:248-1135(-)